MVGTKRKRHVPLVPLVPLKPERIKPAVKKAKKAPSYPTSSAPARSALEPTATTSRQRADGWHCASVVDEQAAVAVECLLRSDNQKQHGATLKSLVLAAHVQNKKATYAVTCETLKHLSILRNVLAAAELLESHDKLSEPVALVLLQELLYGKGLQRNGPAERAVLSNEALLRELLGREKAVAGHQGSNREQAAAKARPRWARVNLLKLQPNDLCSKLRERPETAHLADQVEFDALLPDLVRFPAGTQLHDHPLVLQGCLILQPPRPPHPPHPLQSKASCIPAHALRPEAGWEVVDCCAAPGNKTTHVAALLASEGGGGRVHAFDRDPKRLHRLQANAALAGAGAIISAAQADFLTVDPQDAKYSQVKGVILDPSCSGSGTAISRMDYLLPSHQQHPGEGGELRESHLVPAAEKQRVDQLAKFQEAALLHALQFPALERLVYSTCSTYQRENEDVVAAVLPHARSLGFELGDAFPSWPRRGLPVFPGSEKLLRTDPFEDATDGFFVAVFQRSESLATAGLPTAARGVEGKATFGKARRHKKRKAGA